VGGEARGVSGRVEAKSPAVGEILGFISNPTNSLILASLMGAEAYPRELALRLGIHESHVVERLKFLERLNLVKARWKRLDERRVAKVYSANLSELRVVLDRNGIRVESGRGGGRTAELAAHSLYVEEIPEPEVFVGRGRELELLRSKKGGLTVVVGIPGIGKTTLLAKHARMLIYERHAHVFWHTVRESDSLGYVLSKLASFLEGVGYTSLTRLMRAGVTERSTLIDAARRDLERAKAVAVFDDYHYARDVGITQLVRTLAGSSDVRTFLASRTRPTELYVEPGIQEITLGGYADVDAEELFDVYGLKLPTDSVKRLNKEVGGHPLALNALGELAKKKGTGEAAVRLASLKVQDQVKAWLETVLEADELSTLGVLCVFREPIRFESILAVMNRDVREDVLASRLIKLVRLGVVTRMGDLFSVHDVVRRSVYGTLGNPQAIHLRVAAHYESSGEGRSMLEALYHYSSAGDVEGATRILANPLKIHDEGYIQPLMRLAEGLLAKPPIEGEQGRRLRGWLLLVRGLGYERLLLDLRLALRLLREAQSIALECNDRRLLGYALLVQAYAQEWLSNYLEAERLCMEGLERLEWGREQPQVAIWLLDTLATLMWRKGSLTRAVETEHRALKLSRELGDQRNIAYTTIQLAYCYYLKGDYGKALSTLTTLRLPAGNRMLTAYYERARGLALSGYPDRIRDAVRHLNRARLTSTQAGLGYFAIRVFTEEAMVLIKLRDSTRASTLIDQAIQIVKDTGYRDARGYIELARGGLHILEGKLSEAGRALSKADQLLSSNPVSKGRVLFWMGALMALRGDLKMAHERLGEAQRLFKRVGAHGRATQVAKFKATLQASASTSPEQVTRLVW